MLERPEASYGGRLLGWFGGVIMSDAERIQQEGGADVRAKCSKSLASTLGRGRQGPGV